jgi:hypothetical protein
MSVHQRIWNEEDARKVREVINAIPEDIFLDALMETGDLSLPCSCFIGTIRNLFELTGELKKVSFNSRSYDVALALGDANKFGDGTQMIFWGVVNEHDLPIIEECIANRLDIIIAREEGVSV